jgi:outer membrane protein TolC
MQGTLMQNSAPVTATTRHVRLSALLLLALAPMAAWAQMQGPSLLQPRDPFQGSVTTSAATADTLHLSIDEAIRRGLQQNLGLVKQQQNERLIQAQLLSAEYALMPDITAQANTSTQEINLTARGFKPSLVAKLAPGLKINPLVKVDVTSAEADVKHTFFSMHAIDLYRAAKLDVKSEHLNTLSAHGTVVYNVAAAYLRVLADEATVENAQAQQATSRRLLQQTTDRDDAGTATHLDVLRARVQAQNDDQAAELAANSLEKDRIALNRVIGLTPEQKVQLTDAAPYADLAAQPLEVVRASAYLNRKDYLSLLARVRGLELQSRSVRYERLPVLRFNGNYGVTGETQGLYHGTMYAAGTIEFPIFKEAQLRGDADVADAQLFQAREQLDDLHAAVDAQLRDSLMDVAAAEELVKVAESNRDLAREELEQSTERYHAGVDDNLPLVRSQATVTAANSQWVASLYQYNMAKLGLALNAGVLESQYRQYLGR